MIRAIGTRRTNAELIVDCRTLGYLTDTDVILDATYGLGRFWNLWRPRALVTNDLDPSTSADHHHDFRQLPFSDRQFDAVVFDPPYKLNGTPGQGGPATSDRSYGVATRCTWQDRHELIRAGIAETARVCGRTLAIKCQDQVSSGAVRWQTREFADQAEHHGFTLTDMLHVAGYRPQPPGRTQRHAARDYSTLLVLHRRSPR
jgi:hypothetical protein